MITGRVVSVREFGAFVDLGGGIQGLLHVSEMAWARVVGHVAGRQAGRRDHRQGPAPGRRTKISLGLKQLIADPWSKAADTYKVGRAYKGRVTRVADFGVFVELEPGVEG